MGKVKTHRASAKRFSLTGTGKVKLNHCFRRHNTGNKPGKRLRQMRERGYLSNAMADNVRRMITK